MFKLTIEDDEGKTTVVPLARDEMTIGREEGNTIRLTERNVSRRHARLLRQNGALLIEDLASYTGVRVNGTRIAAATPVHEGDQVQIGDYKILLKTDRSVTGIDDPPTIPNLSISSVGAPAGNVIPFAVPTSKASRNPTPLPFATPTITGRAMTPRPATAAEPVQVIPAPELMDGQPTIPLRMLSDVDPSQPPRPEPARPAHLVVLSTELAGRSFAIERASVVIGRTNENDIVLNHRSISRHHAKILLDHDRYTIVDLQSANGVRVNGEDYERVELHAGDMVELGHVRIRFVGPNETFVFDPGARTGKSRFPAGMAFAVAGVALAAVAVLIVQRASKPRVADGPPVILREPPAPPSPPAVTATTVAAAPSPPPATASAPAVAIAPAVMPIPPPSPAVPPPAARAAEISRTDLLANATQRSTEEDWDGALANLDELTKRFVPSELDKAPIPVLQRQQAMALRKRVEGEKRAALAFAKVEQAVADKDNAAVIEHFIEIPTDSVYRKRARAPFEQARKLFVAEHLNTAEKHRIAGECADAKRETDLVERLDPRNQIAKEIVRLCRPPGDAPAVVAVNAPARPPRVRTVATAGLAPAKAETGAPRTPDSAPAKRTTADSATGRHDTATDSDSDAEALMKQSRDAWLHQQCGSAIDLSRKALKAKPGLADAYQVIAVCSCSLKDAEGATRAYARLDDKSRNLVRALCQRNGIVVGSE